MITSDNQDHEGGGTDHMVLASDNNRDYEGNNDTVMTNSGNGSGYSSAGGGRSGHGYGSVGGSVGSGGLQSPVVLGDKDQAKNGLKKEVTATTKLDIATMYSAQKSTNKEVVLKLLFVVMGVGGAGYFVFRAVKKVFS
jgi:hypothetical protein